MLGGVDKKVTGGGKYSRTRRPAAARTRASTSSSSCVWHCPRRQSSFPLDASPPELSATAQSTCCAYGAETAPPFQTNPIEDDYLWTVALHQTMLRSAFDCCFVLTPATTAYPCCGGG